MCMFVCSYPSLCVCLSVHTPAYVYVCLFIPQLMYVCSYPSLMYVCLSVHTPAYVHVCLFIPQLMCMFVCSYPSLCACLSVHTPAYVCLSLLAENPLPPADLQAAPTSDCTVSIMWTTPPTQEDTASADFYIFEIQYIVIGIPGGWAGLGKSSESPFELMVPSRGVNTTYLVRGRGFNTSSVTQGANSNAVGPYISYQDADSSEISDVSGRPVGSGSISVSWSIVGSMCYEYTNVSISCLLINDSTPVVVSVDGEGVANMQRGGVVTVSGLMADSRYDCHVLGRFSEAGGGGGVARIVEERRSEVVRTFTFPNGERK